MKVLYLSLHDPQFSMGGAEKVVAELSLGIRRKYNAQVCAAVNDGDLKRELFLQGLSVHTLPWSKLKTLETIKRLKLAIEEFKPDLVHSHHRYTTFLVDLLFKSKIRIIHTEHVFRSDKTFLFRFGHQATAVHESVREQLIRHYHVPESKVITIPNAVNCPVPVADQVESLRMRYPAPPGHTRVLCVGRLEEQKGHRYLVEAVMRLPEAYRRRLQIFLAGEGSLADEIKSQIRTFQVERCFHFLGQVRHVADYLELCDFLVLPSLWEGMPLVVLEAQSAGRAVLATHIPGTRETLIDGQTGALVPPKNAQALTKALIQWMDQPQHVRKMGEAARAYAAREFSFEVMLSRYYELYKRLAAVHES